MNSIKIKDDKKCDVFNIMWCKNVIHCHKKYETPKDLQTNIT